MNENQLNFRLFIYIAAIITSSYTTQKITNVMSVELSYSHLNLNSNENVTCIQERIERS